MLYGMTTHLEPRLVFDREFDGGVREPHAVGFGDEGHETLKVNYLSVGRGDRGGLHRSEQGIRLVQGADAWHRLGQGYRGREVMVMRRGRE